MKVILLAALFCIVSLLPAISNPKPTPVHDARIVGLWRMARLENGKEQFSSSDMYHPGGFGFPNSGQGTMLYSFGADGAFVIEEYDEISKKMNSIGKSPTWLFPKLFELKKARKGAYWLFNTTADAEAFCDWSPGSIRTNSSFDLVLIIKLDGIDKRDACMVSFSGSGDFKIPSDIRIGVTNRFMLSPTIPANSNTSYYRRLSAPSPWWELEGVPTEQPSNMQVQQE